MNKKLWPLTLAFAGVVALVTVVVTFNQVNQERATLVDNLQSRSAVLLSGLRMAIEPNFTKMTDQQLQSVVTAYSNRERIAGLAVTDSSGKIVASSSALPKKTPEAQMLAVTTMDADKASGNLISADGSSYYDYAMPLHDSKQSVVGAIEVMQYASYINADLTQIWIDNLIRLFGQVLLIGIGVLLILRWIVLAPIQNLAESMRQIRLNRETPGIAKLMQQPFLGPVLKEFTQIQHNLTQARRAASEQARVSLEKIDSPWTEARLKEFTKNILKDRSIIAVSSLEPYVHTKDGGDIRVHVPASGLITAIEPVMQATGGIWVALGGGSADKQVVDDNDSVQVPPDDPKYTLKRVWLSEEEEAGFSAGVCDRALYPLCHMAHVRPIFRMEDWEQYKKVNGKFAETILSEIRHMQNPVIFIQDFQFTLLPRMIKNSRPDATIGMFWHIPWVSAETFSICPWKKEILDGMLGADLLGFHTQLHCNNFIDTVAHELESLIDHEHDSIMRKEHTSLIRAFQASVTFSGGKRAFSQTEADKGRAMLKSYGITTPYVGIGVDRLDYIKGVRERMTALELFFRDNPAMREQFTFLQISSPPEKPDKDKQALAKDITEIVTRINNTYGTRSWKPIVLLTQRHSHEELDRLYRLSDVCLVTSIHDGMNLVSKEYVAARDDEQGVLIVSQFAGASKELTSGALVVNPYNAEQTAEAIHTALTMSQSEKAKNMRKLRTTVQNYNIYRWSAEILKTIAGLS